LPKNVAYFATVAAALAAGYRPCKRCRPLDADDQPPWAGELLEEIERAPNERISDHDLKARGIDPATVRRHFLRQFGMTFQAFTRARRLVAARNHIRDGGKLDNAVFASGYDSHSGFHDAFMRTFGDTPNGVHARDCVVLSWLDSPLGPLVAGATKDGICLLEFGDPARLKGQFAAVKKLFASSIVPGTNGHLQLLRQELAEYFAGGLRRFTVPLVYPGTKFQRRVWEALLAIPHGETCSYKDIAIAIGAPKAARAVGRANGLNRVAIVIPCHRVINESATLGGYGGGLARKRFLLDLERAAIAK
jgi:AraC family transcriptional regulator of adaptative response/methylated-DNA-[protein]-cysteine methyltransferase